MIYKLNKKLKQVQSTNYHEVTELLSYYLEEIKEENNQLKNQLMTESSINEENEKSAVTNESEENPPAKRNSHILPIYEGETEDEHVETSLEAQVLNLHRQHVPSADIARKLNCGKTEVDLIIKFHGNEQ